MTQLKPLIFALLYLVVPEIKPEFVLVHWLLCLRLFQRVLVYECEMFELLTPQ